MYCNMSDLLYTTQRALLGKITPNMRQIYVAFENDKIKLVYVFDGKITDDDNENIWSISSEIIHDLEFDFEEKIISCSPPDMYYPSAGYRCVYGRKEHINNKELNDEK